MDNEEDVVACLAAAVVVEVLRRKKARKKRRLMIRFNSTWKKWGEISGNEEKTKKRGETKKKTAK